LGIERRGRFWGGEVAHQMRGEKKRGAEKGVCGEGALRENHEGMIIL